MRGSRAGFDTPRDGYFPVDSAQLYFRDIGTGAPIVVLHGGPDFNHNYLLPELDRSAGTHRLIYYDQRGRGKSSPGVAPESVGIDSEVDDLDQVRQHLGLGEVALLGHSWGCVLALEYATRHPHRIASLILSARGRTSTTFADIVACGRSASATRRRSERWSVSMSDAWKA